MLKKLLSSCLDAYRGSHKSVVAGRYIATDLSFPTGYENVNRTTAGVPFLQVGEECGASQGRTPDNAEDHFVLVWRNNDP